MMLLGRSFDTIKVSTTADGQEFDFVTLSCSEDDWSYVFRDGDDPTMTAVLEIASQHVVKHWLQAAADQLHALELALRKTIEIATAETEQKGEPADAVGNSGP